MPTEGLLAYLPIGILMVVSAVFAVLVLLIAIFVGPRSKASHRMIPYESGIIPTSSTHRRFPVKFYLVAMLFIVFDIEAVFFYPWAVAFRRLGLFGLIEMVVFIGILLVGYFYIVKRGALEWE